MVFYFRFVGRQLKKSSFAREPSGETTALETERAGAMP